jgi:23S rRNA pseudouridine2604 synthase
MSEPVRINKYLSTHGYCSRREADRLVKQGNVYLNDRVAKLGDKVADGDDVRVEGRDRKREPKKIYIMLNKPVGLIVTTDQRRQDNVIDYIDYPERIYPVGRLDVKSSGLLLLTNDGTLANRLMHPRYEHEKEYVVTVDKPLDRAAIAAMQNGIELKDGMTLPAQVRKLDPTRFAIILQEGRNRQIRRMVEAVGYEVMMLKRTRVATLKMVGSYPSGKWRHLTISEIRALKKHVGMDPGLAEGEPRKKKGRK